MTVKTEQGKQIPVNVVGSSSFARYNKISSEKTFNMYISDDWLINFAGYRRLINAFPTGIGEGRGIFRSIRGGFLLYVVNANVFTFDGVDPPFLIGVLASQTGEVFIDENLNSQICIVDGVNAYIYNWSIAGANLTVQVLAGTLIPNYVCYHNTFFLFGNGVTNGNGAAWYAYSYLAPTTIQQTSMQALQTKPDFAIAVERIPGQSANVLVFGTAVCEIQTQVGGTINYRANKTISIDFGCISVGTIAANDKYIAWLAVNESNSAVIMVYSGQGAERISTDGIDYLLGQVQFPAQSTASFVTVDGHLMYQLTFFSEADNFTLVYDFNTKKFFNITDEFLNYHQARHYAYLDQTTYFISLNNAGIYALSTNYTTYNENIMTGPQNPALVHDIPRIRICQNISQDDGDRFITNYFTFILEQGNDDAAVLALYSQITPLITEDGFILPDFQLLTENGEIMVDEVSWAGQLGDDLYAPPYKPRVDLTISLDGGVTWSNTVGRDLNPSAYRKNIINWQRLGASNYMTLKLRFWGMSRFVAYNGILEVRR